MMTIPFTEQLSERWLLERTYHAQLRNGQELSVPDLTEAMKQLIDFDVPLSMQSWKSKLAESLPMKKSANFYVPISAWREISQEEASVAYQQGIPILLYGEHSWKHPKGASVTWGLNRNMRRSIHEDALEHSVAVSGINYSVCYLDPKRGTFSNAAWRAWFPSGITMILDNNAFSTTTFLGPCIQFPYTTHYTVLASDGQVFEYAGHAEAIQGFYTLLPQEVSNGSQVQSIFPQFCYYHDVTCPDGIYRIEFFGSRIDKQGYKVKEAEPIHSYSRKESTTYAQ